MSQKSAQKGEAGSNRQEQGKRWWPGRQWQDMEGEAILSGSSTSPQLSQSAAKRDASMRYGRWHGAKRQVATSASLSPAGRDKGRRVVC